MPVYDSIRGRTRFQRNGVSDILVRLKDYVMGQAFSLSIFAPPTISVSTSVKGFTEISGVAISNATPAVVTSAGHGISDHEIIKFTNSGGGLPTGLTAFQYYYCDYVDADTFRITSTIGGANINTSGSGSGTHSVWHET